MKTDIKKPFLTILEFADEISVHHNTVRKMVKSGRLSAFRVGEGKTSRFRIPRSELERLSLINLENVLHGIIEKRIQDAYKGEK